MFIYGRQQIKNGYIILNKGYVASIHAFSDSICIKAFYVQSN